ncbi:MAG: tetratricopeptide repeat protein [Gemmatimonadota bacterium]|nr:tetratricopeptide repeat protein [Gemmatimonadota bacterium]
MWASVIVLALAASISGINNGFAFDDVHIILQDNRTHSLAHWWQLFGQSYWPLEKGGDLYRPATMLAFAVQWALGGGAPLVFHVVSIVLYAIVCAAFFGILLELLPVTAAWLGAALFAVHPLHVEVVGNIVGQAELLAALFMLIALLIFLRARRRGQVSVRDASFILLLYLLGCLSKEHAILLPLLLIAAEATVVSTEVPLRARLAAMAPLILALGTVGLVFIGVRFYVIGPSAAAPDEANALFLGQPFGIRALTMLRVLLEWIRLFFWPAHLSADYSPRAIDVVTGANPEMLASAAILVGFAGLAWVTRRTAPVATFAFLWTAIALLIPSNLVIPTGFVLAERTLFLASGGVMLGIAAVIAHFTRGGVTLSAPARKMAFTAVGALLLLGIAASGFRQQVWRDNNTLFAQTVVDAPMSYKAHLAYAAMLFEQHRRKAAFEEIRLAHALFPQDLSVLQYAAEQYSGVEGCQMAVGVFARILAKDPRRAESRVGLVRCLTAMGRYADARKTIHQGLATGESMGAFHRLMVINDSVEVSTRPHSGK